VGSVSIIESEGDVGQTLVIGVYPQVSIPPGVQVLINGEKQFVLGYNMCSSTGCLAEQTIDATFVNSMRNNGTLSVVVADPWKKQITHDFNLDGFAAAYDSVP